jgi:hypothetical protein
VDTERSSNLLLEKTEDDKDSTDSAQQKLKNHASGAGVNVKSGKRNKVQNCYLPLLDRDAVRAYIHQSLTLHCEMV